jgi:co-chaperonin GroES (HSP10)
MRRLEADMCLLVSVCSATGLFLPSSATSNPLPEATVIAVGPGAPNKDGVITPVSVQAGDRVLLPGWGGSPIKLGDEVGLVVVPLVRSLIYRYRSITFSKMQRSWPRSMNSQEVWMDK